MIMKELIRANIEQLRKDIRGHDDWTLGFESACERILNTIDTLPNEPVITCDRLEEEIKEQIYERFYDLHGIAVVGTSGYAEVKDMEDIARHFAEWGANHLRDTTEKISEDLEEAAEKSARQYYADGGYSPFQNTEIASHIAGFITGSKWQKKQDTFLSKITEEHLEGLRWIIRTGITSQPRPYHKYCKDLLQLLESYKNEI